MDADDLRTRSHKHPNNALRLFAVFQIINKVILVCVPGRPSSNKHDLRRVQGSEDIRLIFCARLVFQRDARKENLIARVGELVVNMSAGATTGTGKAIAALTGFMKKFWIKLSGMIQKSCGNNTQPN